MHAAQRGETEVFRVVLEFLAEKLSPQEASFESLKRILHYLYCCVDQLPALRSCLWFFARRISSECCFLRKGDLLLSVRTSHLFPIVRCASNLGAG